MKLLTEVALPDFPFRINQRSRILMMGSCFTESIGRRLERYLFRVRINPFGVTYNPISVSQGLDALLQKERYAAEDLDRYNDLWFSFDHYTLFSSPDRDSALSKINQQFLRAKEMIRDLDFLILTWGTAWTYTYRKSGRVVCNCHKMPAGEFSRSRLTPDQITESYDSLLSTLLSMKPDLKVLLTVSPVRHWKDGAHGNQLSKAALLLSAEALLQKYPDRLFYFPSYEILMDELRDYRFYARDMLHPAEQATQYIWDKFATSLLSPETIKIISELDPLLKMFEHRILIHDPGKVKTLSRKKEEKLEMLKEKYPFLVWENLKDIPI